MYSKAKLFGDEVIAQKILRERKPNACKRLGRQVSGFDESLWDKWKIFLMYQHNKAKFSQNPSLLLQLSATFPNILVECAPNDLVWGNGLDIPTTMTYRNWPFPGQNLLGKVLTRVRDELTGNPTPNFEFEINKPV
ncbi:hypothetical protein RCL1_002849 [Eukaryota sp. TZLM3-RCL]